MTLSITNFLKSLSEVFFLMSINLKASSPTKYRKCGVSDVIHFKMILATSMGAEPLSNLGLKPAILFRISSEYGELDLVLLLLLLLLLLSTLFPILILFGKLVLMTPGSTSITFILNR